MSLKGRIKSYGHFLQSFIECLSKNEWFKTLRKNSDLAGLEITSVIFIQQKQHIETFRVPMFS